MLNPKLINCIVEPDPIEYLPIWTRHFESYCRFTLLAKNVAGMPLINPFCINRPCEIEELVRSGGWARAQVLVVDPIDRFRLIQYGFASPRFSGPSQPIISPHSRPDCKELFVRLRTALNRFTQALANCRLISGPIPAWEVLSQTSSFDLRPTMGMEWR